MGSLEEHYLLAHLPQGLFSWSGRQLNHFIRALMKSMGVEWGNFRGLEEIVKSVLPEGGFPVSPETEAFCRRAARELGINCPKKLSFHPWNSQALLFHWGVLGMLVDLAGKDYRNTFLSFVPIPAGNPSGRKSKAKKRGPPQASEPEGGTARKVQASQGPSGRPEMRVQISTGPPRTVPRDRSKAGRSGSSATPCHQVFSPEEMTNPKYRFPRRHWARLPLEERNKFKARRAELREAARKRKADARAREQQAVTAQAQSGSSSRPCDPSPAKVPQGPVVRGQGPPPGFPETPREVPWPPFPPELHNPVIFPATMDLASLARSRGFALAPLTGEASASHAPATVSHAPEPERAESAQEAPPALESPPSQHLLPPPQPTGSASSQVEEMEVEEEQGLAELCLEELGLLEQPKEEPLLSLEPGLPEPPSLDELEALMLATRDQAHVQDQATGPVKGHFPSPAGLSFRDALVTGQPTPSPQTPQGGPPESRDGEPAGADAEDGGRRLVTADSHFHLHRLSKRLGKAKSGSPVSIQAIMDHARAEAKDDDCVVGLDLAVASFCDPAAYRDILGRQRANWEKAMKDSPVLHLAVGLHPKYADAPEEELSATIGRMRRALVLPKVVAFGEVGLDATKQVSMELQKKLLRRLLKEFRQDIIERQLAVQVHCRGKVQDPLIGILKEFLPADTRIQVHFFTGGIAEVEKWMKAFPNSYFSMPGVDLKDPPRLVESYKAIPSGRFLLESDSPIWDKRLKRPNSPYQVGYVGTRLANLLGIPHQRLVLQAALRNARRLFGLDPVQP